MGTVDLLIKTGLITKDYFLMENKKEKEFTNIQMEKYTKEISSKTFLMEMESFYIKTETFMREIGKWIIEMDKENSKCQMDMFRKETGRIIKLNDFKGVLKRKYPT